MHLVRRFTIFVLAATLGGTSALYAAQTELTAAEKGRLAPALVRAYESGRQSFRVIVQLKADPEAGMPLARRGRPLPRARLEAVHRAVTRAEAELAARIPPASLEVRHTYDLWPYIAARVDRTGLARLAEDPNVVSVTEDEIWYASTATGIPLMHGDVMHQMGFTGAGTAVALIDTGADYNHPTLGGGPIPNDKIVFGEDTADGDTDPMDCGSHGTGVASVIAGTPYHWDTGQDFAGGVAPDAKLLVYKASPDGTDCGKFSTSDVVKAIDDIIQKRDTYNIVAINLSIGGEAKYGPCDSTQLLYTKAIDDATAAGIAVLVAAGNENKKDQLDAPACVSNAISIGSIYNRDYIAQFQWRGNGPGGILCTDVNPRAKSVPCYSNSNQFLDLMAPADVTTAAKAGGTTEDFDGTSVATPYASGAVAVLAQALPGMDPPKFRSLFELTGEPITDSANGITKPLIDLTGAASTPGVGVGQQTNVTIPNGTGDKAISTVTIDEDGTVSSVRVNVHIVHATPTQLVVTLISPQGTRVKLHDHGPGSQIINGQPGSGNMNGISGSYPDEIQPAESLDAFIGEPAAGTWTLEVLDDDPASVSGPDPRLVDWGLAIGTGGQTGNPPQFASYMIPIGAHLPGGGNPPTFWVTDMRVFNPSATKAANFDLYLVPEKADGTTTFFHTTVNVPASSVASLPDLVKNRFGVDSDKGNLVVQADGTQLLFTSRTYNTGSSDGTFGQYVGSIRGIDAVGPGDGPLTMLQLVSNAAYRTNLGISEASGQAAQVTVTLHDANGAVIGTPKVETVKPFSNLQFNLFDELKAGAADNAYATVEVTGGTGRVTSYATPVDNVTGESIFVPGARPVTAPYQVIPIVASFPGQNGFWVSDVRILNAGASAGQVTLEFRPAVGKSGSAKSVTLPVAAGQMLVLDDVVRTTLGLSDTEGSLRVIPADPTMPLLVTSRTWTTNGAGTYGQFVPAVAAGSGFGPADSATVLHMDGGAGFQSNIGICEVGGGTATVRYVLKDSSGQTLGTGTEDLGPYQVFLVTDVFKALGVTPENNTRVDFFLDSGTGSFTAYGTLIDTKSKDAAYIPAQKY